MLLSLAHVRKLFAADIVLEDITFRIDRREKVALVGRNGSGKTTLLKVISGEYEPEGGTMFLEKGAKVGYLKQVDSVSETRTVLEEAQLGIQDKLEMKSRFEELESKLSNDPSAEDLNEFSLLAAHFENRTFDNSEREMHAILAHMGFTESDYNRPTSELSGGQRTRLALARLLLQEPDLLILDEPTNHLDLSATEWLEEWIMAYPGAVILVSHDRTFLQNTVESVIEIRHGKSHQYPGNFEKFLKLKAEERARLIEEAEKQQKEIEKLAEFVDRFIDSQRTAQARGRRKMMNRLIANRIEVESEEGSMRIGFKDIQRSGEQVIWTKGLQIGYDKPLVPKINWTVRWKERWGVIGENGSGKSTLLKTILGEVPNLGGEAKTGTKLDIGYFSQDTAEVDPEMSPAHFIMYECDLEVGPARDLLAKFLITGDDVFRPSKTLSGGERNKLVLAALTFANPNLLILDEPTNHLDMDSRDALAKVLKDYPGTLVLISHDRWLLGQVTDHIMDVKKSGAVTYPGNFIEYRAWLRDRDNPEPATTKATHQKVVTETTLSPRELSKEIARMEGVVAQSEDQVAEQEAGLKSLEDQLASPPEDADILAMTQAYQAAQESLNKAMIDWEDNCLKLDELREQQAQLSK
ncbi:MAG: ABC-F family ATP-binding cassette domain-containing protein [Armatimonadetes bacterium]|nr:ABC-F family ATP-binding cassette domain-containing protein [Armatimonadota bacterium]